MSLDLGCLAVVLAEPSSRLSTCCCEKSLLVIVIAAHLASALLNAEMEWLSLIEPMTWFLPYLQVSVTSVV